MHKWHPAHEAGSGKARHITHHAAAECKHSGLAVAAVAQQGIKNQIQAFPGFKHLTVGEHHGMNLWVFARQCLLQAPSIQWAHGGIGDNQRAVRSG